MPTSDLVTLDGHKNPDGTWDAHVYQDGQPLADPALTVAAGTEDQVQQLWYTAKGPSGPTSTSGPACWSASPAASPTRTWTGCNRPDRYPTPTPERQT